MVNSINVLDTFFLLQPTGGAKLQWRLQCHISAFNNLQRMAKSDTSPGIYSSRVLNDAAKLALSALSEFPVCTLASVFGVVTNGVEITSRCFTKQGSMYRARRTLPMKHSDFTHTFLMRWVHLRLASQPPTISPASAPAFLANEQALY